MSGSTQDRRPLPGWRDLPPPNDLCRAELGPLMVCRVDFGRGWWLWAFEWSDGNADGCAPTREAAMIAAENGARALADELAAMLGLKVVDGNTPIPSPAVCEALARYAEALTVYLSGRPGSLEDGRWEAAYAALGMLNEAIRAERDGAA